MPRRQHDSRIAAVRRFNRFYTRQIGVLRKNFLDSPYSLGEARVLYEIANGSARTATEIGRALDLDAGYLSRVLRNFEKRGLDPPRQLRRRDARQSHLTLSPRGRKAYAPLERRRSATPARCCDKLAPARPGAIDRGDAYHRAATRRRRRVTKPSDQPRLHCARTAPGDFGWIVKRNAEIYAEEYGWTAPFEGAVRADRRRFRQQVRSQARALLDRRNGRRDCRLVSCWRRIADDSEGRPHPPAARRSEGARARRRRAARRRMHPLRPPRRLQEDHAVDPQRAHRRAPHLSESGLSAHAHGTAPELGPSGGQRALGFGVVTLHCHDPRKRMIQ